MSACRRTLTAIAELILRWWRQCKCFANARGASDVAGPGPAELTRLRTCSLDSPLMLTGDQGAPGAGRTFDGLVQHLAYEVRRALPPPKELLHLDSTERLRRLRRP